MERPFFKRIRIVLTWLALIRKGESFLSIITHFDMEIWGSAFRDSIPFNFLRNPLSSNKWNTSPAFIRGGQASFFWGHKMLIFVRPLLSPWVLCCAVCNVDLRARASKKRNYIENKSFQITQYIIFCLKNLKNECSWIITAYGYMTGRAFIKHKGAPRRRTKTTTSTWSGAPPVHSVPEECNVHRGPLAGTRAHRRCGGQDETNMSGHHWKLLSPEKWERKKWPH